MKAKMIESRRLRKPEWEILDEHSVQVLGIRFGPDNTYLAGANMLDDQDYTTIWVKFMSDGLVWKDQFNIFSKNVKRRLHDMSEASLIQYWARMISDAVHEVNWGKATRT